MLALAGCGERAPPLPPPEPEPEDLSYAPQLGIDLAVMDRTPGGVYVQDTFVGGGQVARRGREVVLEYTTWLHDGTRVASSAESGGPLVRRLGQSDELQGLQEGVIGMREGGERKLVIPARLAYGVRGQPPRIPPQAVLVMRVELRDVR